MDQWLCRVCHPWKRLDNGIATVKIRVLTKLSERALLQQTGRPFVLVTRQSLDATVLAILVHHNSSIMTIVADRIMDEPRSVTEH